MEFIQCPNGKVWKYEDGWVEGVVSVSEGDYTDLEQFLDAMAVEATGSSCGLTDISYDTLGGGLTSFNACLEEVKAEEWEEVEGYTLLNSQDDLFTIVDTFAEQFNLSDTEKQSFADLLFNETPVPTATHSFSINATVKTAHYVLIEGNITQAYITVGTTPIQIWDDQAATQLLLNIGEPALN